jgi:hypothetical protein
VQGEAHGKAKPAYDLKATHYKIGTDKVPLHTTHKTDFNWKDPVIGDPQSKERVKDLRAHHFNFGNDGSDYKSENAANYVEKPIQMNSANGPNPYKNSYRVSDGTKGQPSHFTSVYKEEMVPKELQPHTVSKGQRRDYQGTLTIGNPNSGFEGISEFTDKFVPKQIENKDRQMQEALKKELLSTKIHLGGDKNNYDTTYLSEHDDKGYCKPAGQSEEVKRDLRKTHYKLGYGDVRPAHCRWPCRPTTWTPSRTEAATLRT